MECQVSSDVRRKMIELSLEAYKKRLSPQTGFVHLFYDDPNASSQDSVPMLENMYYVLALFRSKMSDEILEGRKLLERLLSFEVEGNFPIYLHHFPECKDRSLSVHMLVVIHYLLKDFKQVLGDELAKKIKSLSERIVAFALVKMATKPLPFAADVKLQGFLQQLTEKAPQSSSEFGCYLIALHMMPSSEFILNELTKVAGHYNKTLAMYIPQDGVIEQEGYMPRATLFDLFMSQAQVKLLPLSRLSQTLLLQAPLVHSFPEFPLYALRDKQMEIFSSAHRKSLSIYWVEEDVLRSLCLETLGEFVSCHPAGQDIFLECLYPEESHEEEELTVYIDGQGVSALCVDGERASVFSLDDEPYILTARTQISFRMSLTQGKGRFVSHLSKANRQSQVSKKEYLAFDWRMAVRTLTRDPALKVAITITFSDLLNQT